MRILHQINFLSGLGADRWIVTGYKDAFEELGHDFFFLTFQDDLAQKIREVRPDIILIAAPLLTASSIPALRIAHGAGVKVVVWVDSFVLRDPVMRSVLVGADFVDLYRGETEPEIMEEFARTVHRPYFITPNAANPKYHFPVPPVRKYECDIVFLGAMMPNKRAALEELLLPLRKKYDVRIYGPNWTLGDNLLRAGALAARKAGLMQVNDWLNNRRMSIPIDEENQLYSSAKICLNIHERGEHIKTHLILNERTFKIPACGGFEICDFVPPLRRYFTEEEMVMADDQRGDWVADWFRKIDFYLKHDDERKAIQARGTARALRDHTYRKRVEQLFGFLGIPDRVLARSPRE
jgi:spore maturation protein CgeB